MSNEALRQRLAELKPATPAPAPTTNSPGLPAVRATGNAFARIAARRVMPGSDLSGPPAQPIMKLNGKTGKIEAGKFKDMVPYGLHWLVLQMLEGWQVWKDGRPGPFFGEDENGELPAREALGQLDQRLWPMRYGKPQDPVEPRTLILMVGLDEPFKGVVFRFVCGNVTARIAGAGLALKIAARDEVEPGARPVIRLSAREEKGAEGDYYLPVFDIESWRNEADTAEALSPTPAPDSPPAHAQAPLPSPNGNDNDENENDDVPWD